MPQAQRRAEVNDPTIATVDGKPLTEADLLAKLNSGDHGEHDEVGPIAAAEIERLLKYTGAQGLELHRLATLLAASESRWSVQREAASQLRLDRAKCVAMLEKAMTWIKSPLGMDWWAREKIAEIDTLLSTLRTAAPDAKEGAGG